MKKPETRYVARLLRALKKKFGGRWFKNHGNEFTEVGLPDLFGCVGGIFIAIEAKQGNNTTKALQEEILKEIRDEGGIAISSRSVERTIKRIQAAVAKTKRCRVVYIEAEDELPRHGDGHRKNYYNISESGDTTSLGKRGRRSNYLPRRRRPRVAKRD